MNLRPPTRFNFWIPTRLQVALISLVAVVLSVVLSAFLEIRLHSMSHGQRVAVLDVAMGAVSGLYVFGFLAYLRYTRRVSARLIYMVELANREVRAGVQVMLDSTKPGTPEHYAVLQATDHIEFAVRELLPAGDRVFRPFDLQKMEEITRALEKNSSASDSR